MYALLVDRQHVHGSAVCGHHTLPDACIVTTSASTIAITIATTIAITIATTTAITSLCSHHTYTVPLGRKWLFPKPRTPAMQCTDLSERLQRKHRAWQPPHTTQLTQQRAHSLVAEHVAQTGIKQQAVRLTHTNGPESRG